MSEKQKHTPEVVEKDTEKHGKKKVFGRVLASVALAGATIAGAIHHESEQPVEQLQSAHIEAPVAATDVSPDTEQKVNDLRSTHKVEVGEQSETEDSASESQIDLPPVSNSAATESQTPDEVPDSQISDAIAMNKGDAAPHVVVGEEANVAAPSDSLTDNQPAANPTPAEQISDGGPTLAAPEAQPDVAMSAPTIEKAPEVQISAPEPQTPPVEAEPEIHVSAPAPVEAPTEKGS